MDKVRSISIIIPSAPDRNPDAVLENLKQIAPKNLEIEVLVIKGTWPPLQRNLGIKQAKGDLIFFFDDDIEIPSGSIEQAIKTFETHPDIQVVGGPNLTPKSNTPLQHCFGKTHSSWFTAGGTAVRYYQEKNLKHVDENTLITCNIAFRASTLKQFPFNTSIYANEENELLGRMVRAGHKITYNADFFIYHHRRKTYKAFFKQIFSWGQGRMLHTLKQPSHFSFTFFVPFAFILYFISFIWFHPFWYFIPLALYLILDLSFTLYETFNNSSIKGSRFNYLLRLPFIFFLTHIIYGFGLISGLYKIFITKKLPSEQNFKVTRITL